MSETGLIDTSAIVALLDPREEWHRPCIEALSIFRPPFVTSQAVLTESFHLAERNGIRLKVIWTFLRSGAITLGTISDAELPELNALMFQYADRPMDFADATLVHLARRESLTTIFTTDHDDFETYRIEGKKRFRIVPGRRP